MLINSIQCKDSFIEIEKFPLFGDEYTIQFWMKPYTDNFNSWVGLVERGDGDDSQGIYLYINELWYTNAKYGRVKIDITSNLPKNEFTHISITHKGEFIKYYRNGEYINTFNTGKSINTKEPLYLGEWIGGYPIFDGELADVRIWNISLDDKMIYHNYNNNISNNSKGLTLRCLFENENFTNMTQIKYNIISYNKFNIINNSLKIKSCKCIIQNNNKYMTLKDNQLIEIEFEDVLKNSIYLDELLNDIKIGDNYISPISLLDKSFKLLIISDNLT